VVLDFSEAFFRMDVGSLNQPSTTLIGIDSVMFPTLRTVVSRT
jgi:hypothetical protein